MYDALYRSTRSSLLILFIFRGADTGWWWPRQKRRRARTTSQYEGSEEEEDDDRVRVVGRCNE